MPEPEKGKKNEEETIIVEEGNGNTEEAQMALKKVKEALKNCEKEKKEYLNGWKRAKADAANEKKRQNMLLETEQKAALGRYAMAMLPVLDAIRIAISGTKDPEIVSGIKQIETQCMKSFSEIGVEILDPAGEPFNPHEHQAVGERAAEDKKENETVVEVARVGAKTEGGVLRAAMVYVGKYKTK